MTAGCAAQRYHAAPISPKQTAASLESRSLDAAGLRAYIEASDGHALAAWPPKSWDLHLLTLAALYYNPIMERQRARVAEAEAATVTAGARPNPTLGVAPGVPSPYLFNLNFNIPIETAGKRGYRIRSARSLQLASRLALGEAAWKVRRGVRAALLGQLVAEQRWKAWQAEEKIRRERVRLLDQRLQAGEIAQPIVDTARLELAKTHLATVAAQGRVREASAALAAAIAVPVSALKGMDFSWPELDSPPETQSLSQASIRRDAILNRLDVRRALAEYAAREAQLQLQIAKQYPDINIGPGYAFEEGKSYFRLALAATLPIFNRNQGPIAEAEARRKEAGAAFLQTQANVVAQSEQSLARYTSALHELTETDRSLRKLQDTRLRTSEQAVRAGEEDRLALSGVQLESAVLVRSQLDALERTQRALGELEDALELPLDPGEQARFPSPGMRLGLSPADSSQASQPRSGHRQGRESETREQQPREQQP